MKQNDELSQIFYALSDPTRRSILNRLSAKGEMNVLELASPYKMSLPAISKHLKVLEKSKLIQRSHEAQWRPCQLEAKTLEKADNWISEFRKHWEEKFDRLDEYLKTIQNNKEKK